MVKKATTEKGLVKYDINTAAISEMARIYMNLTISDVENKDEFDAVHSARMVVKGHRVALDKAVKAYNDQANVFKKKVKEEAAPLYNGLEPIESHLQAEEDKVLNEQKRRQEEADQREREKIQAQISELQKYGVVMSFMDVAMLTYEDYQTVLAKAISDYEAEQNRLAEEAMKRQEEQKRLDAERAELERQKKEQADLAEKIRLENEKIKAEMEAKQEIERRRQAEERRKLDAERQAIEAEKAKIAAEEIRKKAEADEKRWRDRLSQLPNVIWNGQEALDPQNDFPIVSYNDLVNGDEEAFQAIKKAWAKTITERAVAEAARKEAMRPDREKIIEWVKTYRFLPAPPILQDPQLKAMMEATISSVLSLIEVFCDRVKVL